MFTRDPNDLPTEAYKNISRREYRLVDAMFTQMTKDKNSENTQIWLRANHFERHREPKHEGLLFVHGRPRDLPAHQHEHVAVRWDERAREHQIENAPRHEQTFPHDSLQVESQHKLCPPCRGLLEAFCKYYEQDRTSRYNLVAWHNTIASLVVSVKCYECFVCSLVETFLSHKFRSLLIDPAGLADFRIEVCWGPSQGEVGMEKLFFAAVNSKKPKHTSSNYFYLTKLCAWPANLFGAHFFQNPHHGASGDAEPDNGDERRKRLACSWIDRCVSNSTGAHTICAIGDGEFVPTRLLDVGYAAHSGRVPLVSVSSGSRPLPQGTRYCTLSHCWGENGAQRIPLLRTSNIDVRSTIGISVTDLTPTFKDAIAVCHWFEIKYLWIDSFCIIQDSVADWQKEASLMSKIYKGAWLNISADVGEDAQAGLFHETTLLDRTWPQFRSLGSESSWTLTPFVGYFIHQLQQAPSFSRAWVHRERQLSRRILHFTAHGISWECCQLGRPSYATESFPGQVPFNHFFMADNKYQIGRLEQAILPNDEETYSRWNDVCEALSTKKLTVESDRWLIISTIAEDFSRLLPDDEYVAGHWRSTLPHSLLWSTPEPRGNVTWAGLEPSWSWLANRLPVDLAKRGKVFRKAIATVAEVMDVVASLTSPDSLSPIDPFGHVQPAALLLRGYLRAIRLSLEPETQRWKVYVLEENLQRLEPESPDRHKKKRSRRLSKRWHRERTYGSNTLDNISKAEHWRFIGESWDDNEGKLCVIKSDWLGIPVPYHCFAFFITLEQRIQTNLKSSHREIECLLLEWVPGQSMTFRRSGKLNFADDHALKLRYQVPSTQCFDYFDEIALDPDARVTPRVYIKWLQLDRTRQREQGEEEARGSKDAIQQGVDGLYQYDGDVQDVYPWLRRLEPTVVKII